MLTHTFAICAYKESPYLEACIRSLKRQSVKTGIILCTSTPGAFLEELAVRYQLPLYIRDGASDIQDDWNFAWAMAGTGLVTTATTRIMPGLCWPAGSGIPTPRSL